MTHNYNMCVKILPESKGNKRPESQSVYFNENSCWRIWCKAWKRFRFAMMGDHDVRNKNAFYFFLGGQGSRRRIAVALGGATGSLGEHQTRLITYHIKTVPTIVASTAPTMIGIVSLSFSPLAFSIGMRCRNLAVKSKLFPWKCAKYFSLDMDVFLKYYFLYSSGTSVAKINYFNIFDFMILIFKEQKMWYENSVDALLCLILIFLPSPDWLIKLTFSWYILISWL